MDSERYRAAKELFLEVCDLSPSERLGTLHAKCTDDPDLRAEVESLLRHYDEPTAESAGGVAGAVSDGREPAAINSVGPYRIIREIGRGGMGIVYLGVRTDDRFKRRVAIKVLKRGVDTDEVLRRFELERQLLAALNHPGIARLFDAGETDDGTPYFVLEYIEGHALDEYCDLHRLGIDERLDLFCRVCSAVHYAHQNLVVHRDLKPSNIIVTKDGHPKLLDFGIAKLVNPDLSLATGDPTAPGLRVMTPEFASPEQVRGDPITTVSDVYSLGVLLYELVSGHLPYRLHSRAGAEIARVVCEEDPEKPSTAISRVEGLSEDASDGSQKTITPESVSRTRESRPERLRRRLSGDIDNIVLMAMRKEPRRRYSSAHELAEDIRRHLAGMPVKARPDTLGYRISKFVSRNRAGVLVTSLLVLSLIVGIAGTTWNWRQAEIARADAERERRLTQIACDDAISAGRKEAEQRRIAEAERARAERLYRKVRVLSQLTFFDFPEQIRYLDGATAAREHIAVQAVAFLQELVDEAGDDLELKRDLAFGYDMVGEIQGSLWGPELGNTEQALESYRTALAIRHELAQASPEDPDLMYELSISHTNIGHMLRRVGDTAGALESHRRALGICETIQSNEPQDPDARRQLAIALANVGAGLMNTGDALAAAEHYDRSLALREGLAAERPDDPAAHDDLARIYLRIGSQLAEAGDYESALEKYRRAVQIREMVAAAEPHNSRWTRVLAVSRYFVGDALLSLNRPAEAMEHLEEFLAVATRREREDPANAAARRDLAVAHEIIGTARIMMGSWDDALGEYRTCQSIVAALHEAHPKDTQYRNLLSISHEGIGEALAGAGELKGAIEHGRRAMEISRRLVETDPDDVDWREQLGSVLMKLGIWLAADGQVAESLMRLEAAREQYASLLDLQPQHASHRSDLARTLHELAAIMMQLNDGDAALRYARQAVETAGKPTPQMLRDLAAACYLRGSVDRAIEFVSEALRMSEVDLEAGDDALRRLLEEDLGRYLSTAETDPWE